MRAATDLITRGNYRRQPRTAVLVGANGFCGQSSRCALIRMFCVAAVTSSSRCPGITGPGSMRIVVIFPPRASFLVYGASALHRHCADIKSGADLSPA